MPKAHAAVRAKQRYKLDLTRLDLLWIAQRIESGDGCRRADPDENKGGAHDWWVQMPKGRIRVVYDERTRKVITALPLKGERKAKEHNPEIRQSRRKYDHLRLQAKKAEAERVEDPDP